jgi:hypothetical protein
MRQLLSTALVACIVGALAGASFGAVAQAPAEPPISTTALNADTVDGLSAVKATNKKTKRRNRLVAADAKGFLPANIVKAKWGLISGKPAFLADGVVGWNEVAGIPAALADGLVGWGEVQGIPAGFADGVDNVGYASATQATIYNLPAYTGPGTGFALVYADVPLGVDVELYIIPTVGASMIAYEEGMERGPRATSAYDPLLPAVPADTVRRVYFVENNDATATTFKVRTRVYDSGIAPAALKKVAKQVKVGVVKVPKRAAKSLLRRIAR